MGGGGVKHKYGDKNTMGFLQVCRNHSLVEFIPNHKHLVTKRSADTDQLCLI